MPHLSKKALYQFIRTECRRQLRLNLSPPEGYQEERDSAGMPSKAPNLTFRVDSLWGRLQLGHSTITMTLDTYSHVLPGLGEAAADRLEAMLAEG